MHNPFKNRSALLTVGAATAIVVLAGGSGAVAGGLITSAKIKNDTIQSIDVKNGTLRSVDVLNNSLTGADIKDGSLSNKDIGVYYATVSPSGVIVNQSGGVTALKLETGTYEIDFHRNVTGCGFAGTIGDPGDDAETGQIDVADRSGNVNAVWVRTHVPDGSSQADRSFHLVVVC